MINTQEDKLGEQFLAAASRGDTQQIQKLFAQNKNISVKLRRLAAKAAEKAGHHDYQHEHKPQKKDKQTTSVISKIKPSLSGKLNITLQRDQALKNLATSENLANDKIAKTVLTTTINSQQSEALTKATWFSNVTAGKKQLLLQLIQLNSRP